MFQPDLQEYLKMLDSLGKLVRITREINKDTELMPLVRWQFRGLPEAERKAFLFENVIDSQGRRYTMPVAVGTHAASREIYALALGCKPGEISEKWSQAESHPIPPEMTNRGLAQEVVCQGPELDQGEGLALIPVPISTPGFDPAPFITSGCWVTKDPDSGIRNVGVYRGQIKSGKRLGVAINLHNHMGIHWRKAKERGQPLEAAIVLGGPPVVGLVGAANIPFGTDEFSVAGGLASQPLKLIKCRSVDLEVPATAEIVIEGIVSTKQLEPEGPFGEYLGYMGMPRIRPYLEVTCITHRKKPVYHAFLSQMPPSESSKLSQISCQALLKKFLQYDCNIAAVKDVALHESGGVRQLIVISLDKRTRSAAKQALLCVAGFDPVLGKIIIAVDDDIDPWDPESVNWALSTRMMPHVDVSIVEGKIATLDPSGAPPGLTQDERDFPPPRGASAVLIDATRTWNYSPVALPKREYMERARQIWKELCLPVLSPRQPWYGYSLGDWAPENELEAQLATRGLYFQTGEKAASLRQKA